MTRRRFDRANLRHGWKRVWPLRIGVHIVVMLAGAIGATVLIAWWFGVRLPNAHDQASKPFEGVKLVLAIVAGIGGVVALTVAYRKQRLGESTEDRERSKQFHERFAAATEQLGSAQANVRSAGAYAVAHLADDWDAGRQTCINVLCDYLRMPYTPPGSLPDGTDPELVERHEDRARERRVRHTVMDIIGRRLRLEPGPGTWHGHDFDFSGATIDGGDLTGAKFTGGHVNFHRVTFTGSDLDFTKAEFSGADINLSNARFLDGTVFFGQASFTGGRVDLLNTRFDGGTVSFRSIVVAGTRFFLQSAEFGGAEVDFGLSSFESGEMIFALTRHTGGRLGFDHTKFRGANVTFVGAKLEAGDIDFSAATFAGGRTEFGMGTIVSGGTIDFGTAGFTDGELGFQARFTGGELRFGRAEFTGTTVDFAGSEFTGTLVDFRGSEFNGGTVDFSGVAQWRDPPKFDDFGATVPERLHPPSGFPLSHPIYRE